MSKIIPAPIELMKRGDVLQGIINGLSVVDDKTVCIMAKFTRQAVTVVADIKEEFDPTVSEAHIEHKQRTSARNNAIESADGAAAEGRLKIEQWANEQYELAKEATDNGNIPTRLFPDMDGVTLTPKLVPIVVNAKEFFSWCIETGNMHLIKVDEIKLKKYVNSAGTQARSIPGADVKVQYSATIRRNK